MAVEADEVGMNYWMRHVLKDEISGEIKLLMRFLKQMEPLYIERMDADYILDSARDGRMFFDILTDENDEPRALFILELITYPKTNVLRVMGAAGDIGSENLGDALLYTDGYFTDLARKNGFGFVEYEGRPGWGRLFRKLNVPIVGHELVIRKVNESSHEDSLADDGGPREVRAARG